MRAWILCLWVVGCYPEEPVAKGFGGARVNPADSGDSAAGADSGLDSADSADSGPDSADSGDTGETGLPPDGDSDGFLPAEGDCNDSDPAVNPAAAEACNGIDDNCNGEIDESGSATWYRDADGDGEGNPDEVVSAGCDAPAGFVSSDTDCDDFDPNNFSNNAEWCDGVDNDCDSLVDSADGGDLADAGYTWTLDGDGDGYGGSGSETYSCEDGAPAGYGEYFSDCDDADAAVHPGAPDVCDSGVDNDCDGYADENDDDPADATLYYTDSDGDGYGDGVRGYECGTPSCFTIYMDCSPYSGDCDDGDYTVYPGAYEIPDGLDNDCDGAVDEI